MIKSREIKKVKFKQPLLQQILDYKETEIKKCKQKIET